MSEQPQPRTEIDELLDELLGPAADEEQPETAERPPTDEEQPQTAAERPPTDEEQPETAEPGGVGTAQPEDLVVSPRTASTPPTTSRRRTGVLIALAVMILAGFLALGYWIGANRSTGTVTGTETETTVPTSEPATGDEESG